MRHACRNDVPIGRLGIRLGTTGPLDPEALGVQGVDVEPSDRVIVELEPTPAHLFAFTSLQTLLEHDSKKGAKSWGSVRHTWIKE
jgi:hypothetical protein